MEKTAAIFSITTRQNAIKPTRCPKERRLNLTPLWLVAVREAQPNRIFNSGQRLLSASSRDSAPFQ